MPGERSIHDVDTDRPPPENDGPLDAILDSLEEARASLEDLNDGQDEILGSLRGIHGAIADSEKVLGGKMNVMHEEIKDLGRSIARLSRDVARALQVSEQAKTIAEEVRRAASG